MKKLVYIGLLALLACEIRAGTYAQFRTVFGNMDVELFDEDKPATVQNFIHYVQSGLYQDGFFHRLVPNFVIQGGGYYVANRNTANASLAYIPTFPPITNEFGIGKFYGNTFGTIAMAKLGGDTNSASSQWYFNLTNNLSLDAPGDNGFFTVFGRVVRGTNVLNIFRTFTGSAPTNTILNLSSFLGGAFTDFPFLRTNATYSDLVYVDVSLLDVQVQKLTNNTRQISWNSVGGRTNYVEFTTNLPPSWHTLTLTNGTGNPLTVVDAITNATRRFYRVRVDY